MIDAEYTPFPIRKVGDAEAEEEGEVEVWYGRVMDIRGVCC